MMPESKTRNTKSAKSSSSAAAPGDNQEAAGSSRKQETAQKQKKKRSEKDSGRRKDLEAKPRWSEARKVLQKEGKLNGRGTQEKAVSLGSLDDLPLLKDILPMMADPVNTDLLNRKSELFLAMNEAYFERLEAKRKMHPCLSDNTKFNSLKEAMNKVNSQKCSLFSVDIEAFERQTKLVTEIGISIYDPILNLNSINPNPINLHIIIKYKNKLLLNGKFIQDHHDRYLCGNSIVMEKENAAKFIQILVNYYFIERPKLGFETAIVGHSVSGDISWLKSMNINLPTNPLILDTFNIYSTSYKYSSGKNLGMILRRLNIPHSFLHNAGNDSFFTLMVLLKLCDPGFRENFGLDDHTKDFEFNEGISKLKKFHQIVPQHSKSTYKSFKYYETLPLYQEDDVVNGIKKVFNQAFTDKVDYGINA